MFAASVFSSKEKVPTTHSLEGKLNTAELFTQYRLMRKKEYKSNLPKIKSACDTANLQVSIMPRI